MNKYSIRATTDEYGDLGDDAYVEFLEELELIPGVEYQVSVTLVDSAANKEIKTLHDEADRLETEAKKLRDKMRKMGNKQ